MPEHTLPLSPRAAGGEGQGEGGRVKPLALAFASLLAGHGFQMVAPGAGGPGDAASNLAQGRALGRLVAEISRARKSTAR